MTRSCSSLGSKLKCISQQKMWNSLILTHKIHFVLRAHSGWPTKAFFNRTRMVLDWAKFLSNGRTWTQCHQNIADMDSRLDLCLRELEWVHSWASLLTFSWDDRAAKNVELTQTHSWNIFCSFGPLGLTLTKIFHEQTHSHSDSVFFWPHLLRLTRTRSDSRVNALNINIRHYLCSAWLLLILYL